MTDHRPISVTFTVRPPVDPKPAPALLRRIIVFVVVAALVVPAGTLTLIAVTLNLRAAVAALAVGGLGSVTVLPAWYVVMRRILTRELTTGPT